MAHRPIQARGAGPPNTTPPPTHTKKTGRGRSPSRTARSESDRPSPSRVRGLGHTSTRHRARRPSPGRRRRLDAGPRFARFQTMAWLSRRESASSPPSESRPNPSPLPESAQPGSAARVSPARTGRPSPCCRRRLEQPVHGSQGSKPWPGSAVARRQLEGHGAVLTHLQHLRRPPALCLRDV